MAEKIQYARCRVSPGFFQDGILCGATGSSGFVNRTHMRVRQEPAVEEEVEGEVLAYVINEPEDRDEILVELSGEPVVGGLVSWVPKTPLAAA